MSLKKASYSLLALLTALIVFACSSNTITTSEAPSVNANIAAAPAAESEVLTVLWDKGYVTEEDEAIQKVVADWNAQEDVQIELSFYNSGEIAPKTLRSSRAGLPIDILFAAKSVYPVSEWEDKLADVTDVVTPLADSYTDSALEAATIYGSKQTQDRYYAVPLNQSTTHIYYWKDLLAEAGYTPADIPTDWDAFWSFWKTVQDKLSDTYPGIRSLGLPYSADASDTYHIFEHILSAYDVQLLDKDGNLRLDDPEVKAGIIQSLDWYAQFYQDGYVPGNAVKWLDPENNRNFLDRAVVMTPNPTLSIPAAVRNDETIYNEKLGTVDFPNKPDGDPLHTLVSIRQAVIFKEAPNLKAAKDFLTYLTQPAVLSDFLKASYGRYMPPAISQIEADSFWQDPADPHISTVVKTVTDGRTQAFPNVVNPAYGIVMERNVWGKVIHSMALDDVSAEEAAEAAIADIKDIFSEQS